MACRELLIALSVLVAPLPVFASELAPEPGSLPRPTAGDPAWAAYHEAFLAYLGGRPEEARRMLEAIEREHATHPAARYAAELLGHFPAVGTATAAHQPLLPPKPFEAADNPPRGPKKDEPAAVAAVALPERGLADQLRDEQPTGLARAEFVVGQTLNGVVLGFDVCLMANCQDLRAGVASLMIGGGLGLAGSLLASGDGITPGRASLLNAGAAWGFWNGLALGILGDDRAAVSGAGMLIGQVVGVGATAIAATYVHPSAGDVSLAFSGGAWSGVIAGLLAVTADKRIDAKTFFGTTLLASDLGLLAGASIATFYPVSRGRALLIDLGGGLGLLSGLGVAALAGGDRVNSQAVFGSGAAGIVLGLGVAAYLTRGFDLPEVPLSAAIVPNEGGGSFVVGGAW